MSATKTEHAPPAPPSSETPRLYMTPHLQKRKDGLCPSAMHEMSGAKPMKEKPGYVHKPYQTNSALLLQIKEKKGVPREIMELQTLIEAVNKGLKAIVKSEEEKLMTSLRFKPEGCVWKLEFHPDLGSAGNSYRMEVICQAAAGENGQTIYFVDSILIPKKAVDPNPLAPPLSGFKDAKGAFEKVAILVRKAIVRLEFPEFPEGCKGKQFREVYQLNARLKSGSFATVCRGTHRVTGRKVAIKCVLRKDLPPPDDAAIYDEVAILSSVNHPHIVPLIDFFDEKDCYFIIMELMSGGDLFDRIGKKKSYSEADARDLVLKMLKAVAICHQQGIAHCDMKPKNLLLASQEDDSFIKLADFGFAARVHRPKSLTKQCGTPFFVAPEILTRKPYDQQSDMWSVGCIVFLLLSGNLPFLGRSQKELFRKIVSGKYEFKPDDWEFVSDDAKDLVKKLLVLDPDKRITAKAALLHPWIQLSGDRLSKRSLQSTSQKLKTFNAKMKLRSAMIAVDMVSSLKKIGMSTRNLGATGTSGRNLSMSSSVSSGSSGGSRDRDKLRRSRRKHRSSSSSSGDRDHVQVSI